MVSPSFERKYAVSARAGALTAVKIQKKAGTRPRLGPGREDGGC